MPALRADDIRENIARVRERIASAAERSGRRPDEVRLVAITKNVPVELMRTGIDAGLVEVGENRVQEALNKQAMLPGLTWHMVGRLQTNKAAVSGRIFALIQSLDRMRLATALSRTGEQASKPRRCLVQVNVTGASGQGGIDMENATDFVEKCRGLPYLQICGLMALGPYPAETGEIRSVFRAVSALFRGLAVRSEPEFAILSLGMSADYEIAVEEGSTLVRIGTAIFGERGDN